MKTATVVESISFIRGLVFLCLFATVLLCGVGSYFLLTAEESKFKLAQYDSIVKQLQNSIVLNVDRKLNALKTLAEIVGSDCPTAAHWPHCPFKIRPFQQISSMVDAGTLAFNPIIRVDQLASYESFIYDFYAQEGYSTIGMSSFGRGVYGQNQSNSAPDHRYRDTGQHIVGKRQILVPDQVIGHINTYWQTAIMFNFYSESNRAKAVDNLLDCVASNPIANASICTTVTDVIQLVTDAAPRPSVIAMQPIIPADNKTFVPGIVLLVHNWDSFISQILPDYISGVDCVLTSGNSKFYTYRIGDGQAAFVGEGDHHDPAFSAHGKTFEVIKLVKSDVAHSIIVYPTSEFYNQFHTNTPMYASLISVIVVVLTSLIFFVYDWRISRDAREKDIIMNTKRLFVRYISHEIRTPLNTVHVGLIVLQTEIASLLSIAGLPAQLLHKISSWLGLITEVQYSSDNATEVLNDMINFDKILTGTASLEISEVSLWLVVKQSLRPFFVQARSKNIQLSVDMEILQPAVGFDERRLDEMKQLVALADKVKISQVVSNLISNAVKFTPAGGTVVVSGEGACPSAANNSPFRHDVDSAFALYCFFFSLFSHI